MRPGRFALLVTKRRVRRWLRFCTRSFFVSSVFFWCHTSSSAQSRNTSSQKLSPLSQPQARLKFPSSDLVKQSGALQKVFTANHFQYLSTQSQSFREEAATTMPSFDFRVLTPASRSAVGGLDLEVRFNANEETFYFRPSELYSQFKIGRDQTLFVGRKKMPWSRSDQLWKRGLFEPRHMDDPLEARRAGLLGAFYTHGFSRTRIVAFASPLFVPEFGPQQSLEENQFVSRNPWFRPPPSQVQLQNGLADLRYSLRPPEVAQTLTQAGGGLSVRHNFSSRVFIESAYMYKPMNQLLLGFPFVVELGNEGESTSVDVEVNPRVGYHHVSNLTLGREFKDGSLLYSEVMYERPENNSPPPTWFAKQNTATAVVNVTFEKSFRSLLNPNRKLWLSFSNVNGGDARDSGNFATSSSLFERRYQFQQSFAMGWQGRWFRLGKVVVSNFSRAVYDLKQRGYLLSSELNFRFSRSLAGLFRVDTLGNLSLDGEIQDGFLSQFRANDRASMGVRYVF